MEKYLNKIVKEKKTGNEYKVIYIDYVYVLIDAETEDDSMMTPAIFEDLENNFTIIGSSAEDVEEW